jgi:hypothetical protein
MINQDQATQNCSGKDIFLHAASLVLLLALTSFHLASDFINVINWPKNFIFTKEISKTYKIGTFLLFRVSQLQYEIDL